MLQAVSEHERRLDGLRKQTEEKKEIIAKLSIEHNALVKNGGQKTVSGSSRANSKQGDQIESEILNLGNDIEYLEKELETLTDRKKKINLVSDQVGGWANKVVSKLNSQLLLNEGPLKSASKHSLTSLFDQITDIVTDSLEDIIAS